MLEETAYSPDEHIPKHTPLGLGAEKLSENKDFLPMVRVNNEVERDHGRSGVIARVIFKDKEGRIYRDVDLKGMGYFSYPEDGKPPIVDKVAITSPIRGRVEGIQPINKALYDLRRNKLFLDLGIRTQRILALIRLKEIIDENGNPISIADARRKKIINALDEDEPVVTVRAYGTRSRISEISKKPTEINMK